MYFFYLQSFQIDEISISGWNWTLKRVSLHPPAYPNLKSGDKSIELILQFPNLICSYKSVSLVKSPKKTGKFPVKLLSEIHLHARRKRPDSTWMMRST